MAKRRKPNAKALKHALTRANPHFLVAALMVFQVTAMLLLAFKTDTVDWQAIAFAVAMPLVSQLVLRIFVRLWPVDRTLMVVTDTFVVIPSLPILILMTALMKGTSTVILMALVLAMFAWAWPSRQIRSMALTLKERDFIHTARFSGEGTIQIVVTEILPYALSWSLSNFMNATLSAIASESSLAVLGLSPANLISLGNMIQWARARNAIMAQRWFWIGSPILATMLLFIGLFLLITGYNDYMSMKRGR